MIAFYVISKKTTTIIMWNIIFKGTNTSLMKVNSLKTRWYVTLDLKIMVTNVAIRLSWLSRKQKLHNILCKTKKTHKFQKARGVKPYENILRIFFRFQINFNKKIFFWLTLPNVWSFTSSIRNITSLLHLCLLLWFSLQRLSSTGINILP